MRALVIEPQVRLLAWLRRCLEEEGFRTDGADAADAADALARSVGYQLIVLSLSLPDGRALALLRSWRRACLDCPVLAVAPSADERVSALHLGADDCLCRPFALTDFLARVRDLLRRAHRVRDPVLRVRDLEIDTTTHSVCRGGRPIRLSRREYALLQLLAFHRGRVVRRSLIQEHLYDDPDAVTSNIVPVLIRALRRKIDADSDVPVIRTCWGEGYMLDGEADGPEGATSSNPSPRDRGRQGVP
jgi:DNA-binding response OmpR family regulator